MFICLLPSRNLRTYFWIVVAVSVFQSRTISCSEDIINKFLYCKVYLEKVCANFFKHLTIKLYK